MKNTLMKIIGAAVLAILMLATYTQMRVSAQKNVCAEKSGEQTTAESLNRNNNEQGLEGSWNSQVTIRSCQTGEALRTFPAMQTYMRGGTMQEFGLSAGFLRSPGHGNWSFQSEQNFGNRYTSDFQFFRFNADNNFAGKQINRRVIEENGFRNNVTATETVEIYNPAGVLIATACATEVLTRFE